MKFKPMHDHVVIKADEEKTETEGGILLPGATADKPSQGNVLAVGSGKEQKDGSIKPLTVEVGQRVLYHKKAGIEIKIEGEDVLIMREDDILGVIV
jgi:chaperonin GroES